MKTDPLACVVLAAALTLAACGPQENDSEASASRALWGTPGPYAYDYDWVGDYVIEHPRIRLVRSLTLEADGSYTASIVQGTMSVDGCAGPFMGDGRSLGSWSELDQVVTFSPQSETAGIILSLEGATAKVIDGAPTLFTAEESALGIHLAKAW